MSLITYRETNALNQAQLAEKLGFTQPTISRMEADERAIPLATAVGIFRKIGVQTGPLSNFTEAEMETVLRAFDAGVAA